MLGRDVVREAKVFRHDLAVVCKVETVGGAGVPLRSERPSSWAGGGGSLATGRLF